jgi:hypothetical protein
MKMDFVSIALFIPQRTIYHYLNEYHKSGKTRNAAPGGGRANYLTDEQENAVQEDLKNTVYFSTLGIAAYIKEKYGITFSRGGLAKCLTAKVLSIKGLGKCRLQLMRPSNENSSAPIMNEAKSPRR